MKRVPGGNPSLFLAAVVLGLPLHAAALDFGLPHHFIALFLDPIAAVPDVFFILPAGLLRGSEHTIELHRSGREISALLYLYGAIRQLLLQIGHLGLQHLVLLLRFQQKLKKLRPAQPF